MSCLSGLLFKTGLLIGIRFSLFLTYSLEHSHFKSVIFVGVHISCNLQNIKSLFFCEILKSNYRGIDVSSQIRLDSFLRPTSSSLSSYALVHNDRPVEGVVSFASMTFDRYRLLLPLWYHPHITSSPFQIFTPSFFIKRPHPIYFFI